MGSFDVKLNTINKTVNQLDLVAERLDTICEKMNTVNSRIIYQGSSWDKMRSILNKQKGILENAAGRADTLKGALSDIYQYYESTEKKIMGQNITQHNLAADRYNNGVWNTEILNSNEKHKSGRRDSLMYKDYYEAGDKNTLSNIKDVLKLILTAGSGYTGEANDNTGALSLSVLAMLLGLTDFGNPDVNKSALDRFKITENFFSSIQGVLGKGCKIVKDKEKLITKIFGKANKSKVMNFFSEAEKVLGLTGASIGAVSHLADAYGRSFTEQLKNSGGLINDGVSIGSAVDKIVHKGDYLKLTKEELKKITETNKYNGMAIAAIFSMATGGIGFSVERHSDGVFDAKDWSDTFIYTGMTGFSSLVSGITFGAVTVDAEKSLGVFEKNTNQAKDWINSTGAKGVGKAALFAGATVAVAVKSTGETLVNTGYAIGTKINDGLWWIKNKFFG